MVKEGRGRIFRRKDGKYLIYLPKSLVEDSIFPFQEDWQLGKRTKKSDSIPVKVSFTPKGPKHLLIEKEETT